MAFAYTFFPLLIPFPYKMFVLDRETVVSTATPTPPSQFSSPYVGIQNISLAGL